jgi:adenylosuccinate synthase
MVIDPWVLEEELDKWHNLTGERPEGKRLFISERASIILPFHRLYDGADRVVGTTGRGIGPTYRDRIERVGIRFADLANLVADEEAIQTQAERMSKQLETVGVSDGIETDALQSDLKWILERYSDAIRPTGLMIDMALRNGERVLLEGAQGAMLDIDQGTYPFVTSSVTSRANATHGAGIHPGHVDQCFGITKAYTTRVGNGPFPSELPLEGGPGMHMAQVGNEYGTTTGRPRRTGWLDMVALRESNRINGYTGLVVTKLDVLGGLDELKICIGYEMDGRTLHVMPTTSEDLARCTPIYETHPGFPAISMDEWLVMADTSRLEDTGFDSFPEVIRKYIARIEHLAGVPIVSVGVGPDRRASVASRGGPFDFPADEATF